MVWLALADMVVGVQEEGVGPQQTRRPAKRMDDLSLPGSGSKDTLNDPDQDCTSSPFASQSSLWEICRCRSFYCAHEK